MSESGRDDEHGAELFLLHLLRRLRAAQEHRLQVLAALALVQTPAQEFAQDGVVFINDREPDASQSVGVRLRAEDRADQCRDHQGNGQKHQPACRVAPGAAQVFPKKDA